MEVIMELEWIQTVRKKAVKIPVNKIAQEGGKLIFKVCRYLLLAGISYLMIYPVMTMLSTALSRPIDLYNESTVWIPKNPTFTNFTSALRYFDYAHHLGITVSISTISTALQMLVCPLVGYGLARYRFKGNGLVFAMVIMTIIVPIQTAQIPMYLDYQAFDFFGIGRLIGLITGEPLTVNLLNTNWVYYIPAAFGVGLRSGLYIFLFRQYFKGMPKDLEDAGKVDGCSRFGIYLRIIIPNAKPVFVTEFLLSMIFYWNDTVISNMLLNTVNVQPLMPYTRRLMELQNTVDQLEEMRSRAEGMACLFMTVAPLMILFIVCQKFFIECMDRSGIKG